MPSQPPFVDPATGELDTDQILAEALPLGKLIGVFVLIAAVPFAITFLALGRSGLGALFALLAQFVLAVGAGIVLMYVIARARQISGE